MHRLHNLDYLRGIAAFGIMIYHFSLWNFGAFPAESILGRVGIYGVSIFYVLSGLTLYHVYFHKMTLSLSSLKDFWKKRIFRIFPLLWLATILFVIIERKELDFYRIFLNLTGLFGFIKWDYYLAVGSWSIGNELVFYAFLPVFIYLGKNYKTAFWILSTLILALGFYFSYVVFDPNQKLIAQWHHYTNPLNQVFLFLGGFILGYIFEKHRFKLMVNLLLLTVGVVIFIFWPAQGDQIDLVSGTNRIIFSLSCLLISLAFFKIEINIPTIIQKSLSMLGEASYSVYLLHPIVYLVFNFFNKRILHFSKINTIFIASVLTITCSYLTYIYFEKYFMKLAKSKTN